MGQKESFQLDENTQKLSPTNNTSNNKNNTTNNFNIKNSKYIKKHISRANFEFLYVIGRGGFGKVWVVKSKKKNIKYALKEMSKVKIIDRKSEKSIKTERDFLSRLHNPFIVNMTCSFQDYENLYLVMDLLTGGDLRYHLCIQKQFSEEQGKFFCSCIILGLEYIHKNNIIHRDIKPENLVLDNKGYVRITDFGVAKENLNDNSSETSGTPGYMAPEVLCALNHTFTVDFFALGVMAYEFLNGYRPYLGRNRKEIKDAVLLRQVHVHRKQLFENDWSIESGDIINKLISRKPNKRLGVNGILEIKNHPWFKNINWDELFCKKLESPFLPKKGDNFDKRYCEGVENVDTETKQRYQYYMSKSKFKNLFDNYTFVREDTEDEFDKNDKKNKNYDKNNVNEKNYISVVKSFSNPRVSSATKIELKNNNKKIIGENKNIIRSGCININPNQDKNNENTPKKTHRTSSMTNLLSSKLINYDLLKDHNNNFYEKIIYHHENNKEINIINKKQHNNENINKNLLKEDVATPIDSKLGNFSENRIYISGKLNNKNNNETNISKLKNNRSSSQKNILYENKCIKNVNSKIMHYFNNQNINNEETIKKNVIKNNNPEPNRKNNRNNNNNNVYINPSKFLYYSSHDIQHMNNNSNQNISSKNNYISPNIIVKKNSVKNSNNGNKNNNPNIMYQTCKPFYQFRDQRNKSQNEIINTNNKQNSKSKTKNESLNFSSNINNNNISGNIQKSKTKVKGAKSSSIYCNNRHKRYIPNDNVNNVNNINIINNNKNIFIIKSGRNYNMNNSNTFFCKNNNNKPANNNYLIELDELNSENINQKIMNNNNTNNNTNNNKKKTLTKTSSVKLFTPSKYYEKFNEDKKEIKILRRPGNKPNINNIIKNENGEYESFTAALNYNITNSKNSKNENNIKSVNCKKNVLDRTKTQQIFRSIKKFGSNELQQ